MKYADFKAVYLDKRMTLEQWRANLPKYGGSPNAPRTLADAQETAEKYNKVVDKYVVRQSKWSGQILESKLGYSAKDWSCDIMLHLANCPDMAILHELIHARSVSYYGQATWRSNIAIEEASVQLLTQEIARLENIAQSKSFYDDWADILRGLNQKISAYESDLKFAQRLLRVPLDSRIEWLVAKAQKFAAQKGLSVAELSALIEPLYKIEWSN